MSYHQIRISLHKHFDKIWKTIAQSVGAGECNNYFSVEGLDSSNECPGYDTKQSDSGVSVMLELLGMKSTSSSPGSLWSGVVANSKVLSMD